MPDTAVAVRRLMISSAVSSVGTGFVLPLILIYLHSVRHIPLATTGLIMAIPGVVGLVVIPISGALMDRIGAQRVFSAGLMLLAAAEIALAFVHSVWWAAAVLFLRGAAQGPTFPAFNTMLGALTGGQAQQRAFAVNFTLINAGIGVGGLVGSAVIDVHHPGTFQLMFFGDAVASAIAAVLVLSVRVPRREKTGDGESGPAGGYRQILADPVLRRLVLLTFLLAMCGYAALDSGLPAYANVVAHVPARIVALGLSANTLAIVLVQLPVLRLLRGRRRSHAIATVGLIWSASWVLFGLAALPHGLTGREAIAICFAAIFGIGETFMAPSVGPLLNALAPPEVRGRANALTGGMYSIAFIVSPAISAGFISAGLGGVWIALLSAGCLVVLLVALGLGRMLSHEQDVAARDPVPVEVNAAPFEPVREG